MKRALVLSLVLLLGVTAFAQTWEGTWDTDITIVPAAATFTDFIGGFDSDLDVNFMLGDWDFGVTTDFSAAGLDGFGFTATGVLGAFSLSADIDFIPMLVSAVTTEYFGLAQTSVNCLSQTNSITFDSVVVTEAVSPAFEDLTFTAAVSIAGVSFEGKFLLKGTDIDAPTTYSYYETTGAAPSQFGVAGTNIPVLATDTLSIASSTKVGSGAKITISGSMGFATVTSYTYFNTKEYMYNSIMAAYGTTSLENALLKYPLLVLVCEGCDVMWSSEYILIEGISFGFCSELDMAVEFTCCGFGGVDFLFKDIELGMGIDLDFLVSFTTSAKTMSLVPEITLSGVCFNIVTELQYDGQEITGVQIEGLSASQTFGGLTVGFAATWDYSDNPLIGTSSTITHHSGAEIFFWVPETMAADLIGDTAADVTPAIDSSGVGAWALSSASCYYEKATVYNKMSLDYEADACCGGLFELSADTYFGSIATYTLAAVYGTYFYDEDGTAWEVEYDFLGTDFEYVADGGNTAPDFWAAASVSDDDCLPCPSDDVVHAVQYVKIEKDYTAGTENSLFGWVETDIDLSVGVASNVTLDLGVDMTWWGWESLSFGVTFEW